MKKNIFATLLAAVVVVTSVQISEKCLLGMSSDTEDIFITENVDMTDNEEFSVDSDIDNSFDAEDLFEGNSEDNFALSEELFTDGEENAELMVTPTPTVTPTLTPVGTPTSTPIPTSSMLLKVVKANGEGVSWISDTEAQLSFHASESGKYYVRVIKQTMNVPSFKDVEKKYDQTGDVDSFSTTITLTGLHSTIDYYVVVYAKDEAGLEATNSLVLPLNATGAWIPIATPTATPKPEPTPTQTPVPTATPTPVIDFTSTPIPPYTPKVTESTVTGLEEPLVFSSGKKYHFTVVGAGMQNENPVNGDWQWKPLYWSLKAKPTADQRRTIGIIENENGITSAKTYNMYIFFQKYVYDGARKMWKPTKSIESMKYQFSSKALFQIPSTLTLKRGKTSKLNPGSSWKNVKYKTSNKKILTVDKNGKVKAVSVGTAKITVKSGSEKAVCTVTVPGTTAIKNIKSSVTIKRNKSIKLKPNLEFVGSSDKVTYKSSSKKIATVSQNGKIIGKRKGTAIITIKSGMVTKKCKVKVK